MSIFQIVVVVSLVTLAFTGLNYYLWVNVVNVLFTRSSFSFFTFWVLAYSYIFAMLFEKYLPSIFSRIFMWISCVWMGVQFYMIIMLLFRDIIVFIAGVFGVKYFLQLDNRMVVIGMFVLTLILCVYGYVNSTRIRVTQQNYHIDKNKKGKSISIVVASDIHVSSIVDDKRLRRIVEKINSLKPDLVLFPGDVIDSDLGIVIKGDFGAPFTNIKSKYGVYAVPGNHEYIGGIKSSIDFIKGHGINLLRDEVVDINDEVVVVGRDDITKVRMLGENRATLKSLVSQIKGNKVVILMDHQPLRLGRLENSGVDIQFSGHTHNGQVFPANLVTKLIFEKSWGYINKFGTHVYVSCGIGTWGLPMRIGSVAEIVNVKVNY